MSPQRHLLCGTILSIGIMFKSHEPVTAVACLIGSVGSDVDHLIEYSKYCSDYSVKPTFAEFVSGKYFDKKGTVCVLLHGWEHLLLGLIFLMLGKENTAHQVLKGLLIGYASHLTLDQIGNNVSKYAYFWPYRWWHGFKQETVRGDL